MKNYLCDMLADIASTECLTHAMEVDQHLREIWLREASDEFKLALEAFELKHSDNAAAEFIVYIMLTEAMLEEKMKKELTEVVLEERRKELE